MSASQVSTHRETGSSGQSQDFSEKRHEFQDLSHPPKGLGSSKILRVVLADDHPVVRIGVRNLLVMHGQFTVIGEAQNAAETMERTLALKPDVLLMDLHMPGVSGFDTLRALTANAPGVRLVLLTGAITKEQAAEALRCGARGIVLKSDISSHIASAILAVVAGGYWMDGRRSDKMPLPAPEIPAKAATSPSSDPARFQLTRRELEVVGLIVKGYSNREIAKEFRLSEETVKRHLSNTFDKFGMSTRLELAIFAIAHKLITPED